MDIALTEDDIPGASLCGRKPSTLKNEELRFWLKCRGDSLKGLKTKAQLVKRVEEYIESGRDKNVVDPDEGQIYTKRKERGQQAKASQEKVQSLSVPNYPNTGWSQDIQRMPFFTRAEMNAHISRTGKNLDPSSTSHSVPTCIRKATTFLNDEYLKDILATSDTAHFYFKAQCHHSFKKNEPPHNLKLALCIITGEVIHANCTCVAGKVGFCNHTLALMLKICKFSLYECKNVQDLDNEDDVNPKKACTSKLQLWHKKGRGDSIKPQPVMDVTVLKTGEQDTRKSNTSREPGVSCLLYEARNNVQNQEEAQVKLQKKLQAINPKMALSQIMSSHPTANSTNYVETKFGRSPKGSFASYHLCFTEDNFKVFLDISSVPRVPQQNILGYPTFPLNTSDEFRIPPGLEEAEINLLKSLEVDTDKLQDIERKSQNQSDSEDWKKERQFRFTASNFGLISNRKRQHDSLVNTLLHPKPINSRYTNHGKKYEPVAIRQYQRYMNSVKKPVQVFKSGLVVSYDSPYLGASPDGKVIDKGCDPPFGLIEVKCPETKFMVTPLDACTHDGFYLEDCNGQPKLKHSHIYYKQVQGQLGITGVQWCDFVVYTSKGMSIERISFNEQFWLDLKQTLKTYYFTYFLSKAAGEFQRAQ